MEAGGGLNTVTFSLGANSRRVALGSQDQTLLCRVPLVGRAGQVGWRLGVEQSVLKSNLEEWGGGVANAALLAWELHQWEKSCFSPKETS